MKNKTTIEDIKSSPAPQSPSKSKKKLTCAVLNKSPLRQTKVGSMFSMNLCGEEPSSTIRAACFEGEMFSTFQLNTTYDFNSFKIKKAFGNSNSVELLVDQSTTVTTSTSQLSLEKRSYNISQILRNQTDNTKFINLKAKVMNIDDPSVVGSYPHNKTKRSMHLADHTSHIEFVLWRERADNFHFSEGDVLSLENAVVSNFNNTINLTTTFETTITKVDELITVVTTKRPLPKSNLVSLQSSILAIKEFSCAYTCIECRKDIEPGPFNNRRVINCPTSSTVFLKYSAILSNRCSVLLTNKQWLTASTGVSINITEIKIVVLHKIEMFEIVTPPT